MLGKNTLLIHKKNRIDIYRYDSSGEGGIRTHAPLRTNGFQDRLVMTTSIPLHILFHRFLFYVVRDK